MPATTLSYSIAIEASRRGLFGFFVVSGHFFAIFLRLGMSSGDCVGVSVVLRGFDY
jgi:hypothetical protein